MFLTLTPPCPLVSVTSPPASQYPLLKQAALQRVLQSNCRRPDYERSRDQQRDVSWQPPQDFQGHCLSILPNSAHIFPLHQPKQTSPAFKKKKKNPLCSQEGTTNNPFTKMDLDFPRRLVLWNLEPLLLSLLSYINRKSWIILFSFFFSATRNVAM